MYPRYYKRPDKGGTYYIEFSRGDRKSLGTKHDKTAKAMFEKIKAELARDNLIKLEELDRISIKEFHPLFVAGALAGHDKSTIEDSESLFKVFTSVVDANLPIRLLNTDRLVEFRKHLLDSKRKPTTIDEYLRKIKSWLKWAKTKNYISQIPDVPFLKLRKKRLPHFMQPDEIEKVIEHARFNFPEFYPMLIFYLYTGVRRAEACALKWPQVNLNAERPFALIHGKFDKQRMVPLLPPVMEILTKIKKDVGHVFMLPKRKGRAKATPTYLEWPGQEFKKCARAVGCPEHHLHDCRHSFATYMLTKGVPMHIVQGIMGHENISTTVQIYGGIITSSLFEEMGKLDYSKIY
jgi:integrase